MMCKKCVINSRDEYDVFYAMTFSQNFINTTIFKSYRQAANTVNPVLKKRRRPITICYSA